MASALLHEAAALACLNLELACTMFAPVAAMSDALVAVLRRVRQPSPAACAAVNCMSTGGAPAPQAFGSVFQGLRTAVPALVRLASAGAPMEAVGAAQAYRLAGVYTDSDEARHALAKAFGTALAPLRDAGSYRDGTVLALEAFQAAGTVAASASRGQGAAGAVVAAAAATARDTLAAFRAAAAKAEKAVEAANIAIEAAKEAVAAKNAAIAAVRCGAAVPLLAGAAAMGAGNANMGQALGQAASAARGSDEPAGPEQVPDAASEGAGMAAGRYAEHMVHVVADHLAMLEYDSMGPDLTSGRNMCATGWAAAVLDLRLQTEARAGSCPAVGCSMHRHICFAQTSASWLQGSSEGYLRTL